MSSIRKAVVLVAGMGTRLLPATKSQPKEMLPVGRKPTVHYVVQELADAGIREVLFVTGRSKRSIEDHFDYDDMLINRLLDSGREEAARQVSLDELGIRFFYTRQSIPMGTADAVLKGREFAGGDPILVALGDSIVTGHEPVPLLRRMMDSHQSHHPCATIAVEWLPREDLPRYGVVKPRTRVGDEFEIVDIVEKPTVDTAPSNFALAGRYIFEPAIFDSIEDTEPSSSGELLLPDSMRILMDRGQVVRAVRLVGDERRFDIGNFQSYFEAFIEFALRDEEFGEAICQHLRQRLGQAPGQDACS